MSYTDLIRRTFRDAGLYHHAADDLLCGELANVAEVAYRDGYELGISAGLKKAIDVLEGKHVR